MYDFHTHSNYSDGQFLFRMVRAAEQAGLDGIGFTDHCNVSSRAQAKDARAARGFNLDRTYERRRRAIDHLQEESEIAIYDAVEMDYDPRDEDEIRAFLSDADFDYTIGSVHDVMGTNVQVASAFENKSTDERTKVVDRYFDQLVALIDSELFDIAAHIDLLERTLPLRGRATEAHYHSVAEAFTDSRTIPEINVGRALTDEIVHPQSSFLEILREHNVSFTVGTDSHRPDEVNTRVDVLENVLSEYGIKPVRPVAKNH
ncbi:PHP domain-containing protein [Haladaptatus caseinilyticus]|uniref:PHP domain-containing protein n=1 Tax=Haladaptatus caseinilyticus TaxID=2993314 RepID=UPI00224A5515|nr:PHP domain-containing protein [Haladaptatus caseinilyticus]